MCYNVTPLFQKPDETVSKKPCLESLQESCPTEVEVSICVSILMNLMCGALESLPESYQDLSPGIRRRCLSHKTQLPLIISSYGSKLHLVFLI